MEIEDKHAAPGYFMVTIGTIDGRKLLRSNNERAFIISQLQDLLCLRSVLETPSPHSHLAAHIDLQAFSLLERDIRLIVFAIHPNSIHELSRTLIRRLRQYQSEYATPAPTSQEPISMLMRLTGPHHALASTVSLHLRHLDWEYDRYSSIGFYLHDRRGDWMRPWRLSAVFENIPSQYRSLVAASLPNDDINPQHLGAEAYGPPKGITTALSISQEETPDSSSHE